jgi:hypothetical protein
MLGPDREFGGRELPVGIDLTLELALKGLPRRPVALVRSSHRAHFVSAPSRASVER